MNHIEGNYDEIVKYLDDHDVFKAVGNALLHGVTEDGFLNVGLFSMVENHFDICDICTDKDELFGMNVKFEKVAVEVDTCDTYFVIEVEDAEQSHLIRF